MSNANKKQNPSNKQSQSIAATGAVDAYLRRDDISPDVLTILIDREDKERLYVFEKAKNEININTLKVKAASEQKEAADIEKDKEKSLAYHHDLLNFKRKTPALETNNVVEVQKPEHVAGDVKPEKYLHPSYNEVKAYINNDASKFGFTFDVDCVHDPSSGMDEVVVTVFHEKGAIRRYADRVSVKYNSGESAAVTKNRYVSTVAKAMLMNAFGIHFVPGKNVPDDVVNSDGDIDAVYAPNVQPATPKQTKHQNGLSDNQVNVINRKITQSGLTFESVLGQLSLSTGAVYASVDDVSADRYDAFLEIIERSAKQKNKHRANA